MDEEIVNEWIDSKYEPIPSIIEAANDLFLYGEIPYIKNIAEGDIASTVKKVAKLISDNEKIYKRKRIILLVVCQELERLWLHYKLCMIITRKDLKWKRYHLELFIYKEKVRLLAF